MQDKRTWREPFNAASHFLGFWLALFGLWALLQPLTPGTAKFNAFAAYGVSLACLFLASSCYHFFDLGPRGNKWLRRFDHATIYLLIAGTYLPFLVVLLDGTTRVVTVAIVCGLAIAGVIFKFTWFSAPRWLDATLYLALGWFVVFAGPAMWPVLGEQQWIWLGSGGAAYTIGAIIYATKRPDPLPGRFGFHEIWHLFVLAGAGLHYVGVYTLIALPQAPF